MREVLNAVAVLIMVLTATVGAYIQHFITTVSQELWVVMVVGAIIPPVGMLHGWLVWLNVL